MKDSFANMHPVVNFMFFVFVISFSMFIFNPICLIISAVCAFVSAFYTNNKKTIKLTLLYMFPMFLLIVVGNPVFNHEGVSIIGYFPWGNPLTLESILYGFAAATLLLAVILWFSYFNSIMTSDKIICLFGRVIPALSLVISMALRFVPKFTVQFSKVKNSQRCMGRDISDGSVFLRMKNCIKIISIMITWSLENAIETADSMKSRGYGLKGRTSFSIFKFTKRDAVVLVLIVLLGICEALLSILGITEFNYFPYLSGEVISVPLIIYYILYSCLMLIPFAINIWEVVKWKRLKSAI